MLDVRWARQSVFIKIERNATMTANAIFNICNILIFFVDG